MQKRLYRSRTDRILWGVCGGLAKYFDIDPIIIRIIFVITAFIPPLLGFWTYIILAIVVPLEGSSATTTEETVKENVTEMKDTANQVGQKIRATLSGTKADTAGSTAQSSRHLTTLGAVIVALGILLLLANLNWFNWRYFWPVIIILTGTLIIIRAMRK